MSLKRFICCFLTGSVLCSSPVPLLPAIHTAAYDAEYILSGTYQSIDWHIEDDILYLEGEGDMPEEYGEFVPWTWRGADNLFHYSELSEEEQYEVKYQESGYDFVHRVVVGEGITSLSSYIFSDLYELSAVELPSTLRTIGEYAMEGLQQLKSITLPENLEVIRTGAFMYSALESIVIPESVRELESYAFYSNYFLQEITLPRTMDSIGDQCFAHCTHLKDLEMPEEIDTIGLNIMENCCAWRDTYIDAGEDFIISHGILMRYLGDSGYVSVPEGVTQIISGAFYEIEGAVNLDISERSFLRDQPREDIYTIILPDSVTKLHTRTFEDLRGLTTLFIPDSVTWMGDYCISGCQSISDLHLPGHLEYLGLHAVCDGPWLSSYRDFVVISGKYLYRYRGSSKVVHIPDGIETICFDSFRPGDQSVVIYCPDSLRTICTGAFQGASLSELHLNDGLTCIESAGIEATPYLSLLQIPSSVTDLSADAVSGPLKGIEIVGEAGSSAEKFAEENELPFYENEPPAGKYSGVDLTLDLDTDVWKFDNVGRNFAYSYYLTDRDRDALLSQTESKDLPFAKKWNGSCFGMALTVVLAKNGLLDIPALLPDADAPGDASPDEAVQSLINYYHAVQYTRRYQLQDIFDTSSHKFYRMIQLAENVKNGASPFIITYKTENFSHAVVGYGIEYGNWTFCDKDYGGRILIWDPNYSVTPLETCHLYFDTETYEYCIPQYDLYISDLNDALGIMKVINDCSVLNYYPYPAFPEGDLNGDGKISIADAVLMQRHLLGDDCLREAQMPRGDLNADTRLNAIDFSLLKQLILSQEAEIPADDAA